MTAHDELCRAAELGVEDAERCDCDLIDRVRLDEAWRRDQLIDKAHDPMCPVSDDPSRRERCGVCELIAAVRAAERERIAQAIEHFGLVWEVYLDNEPTGIERQLAWSRVDALKGAAQIVREGTPWP